jgi:hypothetical protein
MENLIESRKRIATAEAESHAKMLELCWSFRFQLERVQSGMSPADYIYAESLKTFLLRASGVRQPAQTEPTREQRSRLGQRATGRPT